jgi:hypothetical protein
MAYITTPFLLVCRNIPDIEPQTTTAVEWILTSP